MAGVSDYPKDLWGMKYTANKLDQLYLFLKLKGDLKGVYWEGWLNTDVDEPTIPFWQTHEEMIIHAEYLAMGYNGEHLTDLPYKEFWNLNNIKYLHEIFGDDMCNVRISQTETLTKKLTKRKRR